MADQITDYFCKNTLNYLRYYLADIRFFKVKNVNTTTISVIFSN